MEIEIFSFILHSDDIISISFMSSHILYIRRCNFIQRKMKNMMFKQTVTSLSKCQHNFRMQIMEAR